MPLTHREWRKKYPELARKTLEELDNQKEFLETLKERNKKTKKAAIKATHDYRMLEPKIKDISRQYDRWIEKGLAPISFASATAILDEVPLKDASIEQQRAYKLVLEMSSTMIPFSKETIRNIDENDKMMERIEKWKKGKQREMNKQYERETGYKGYGVNE